MKVIMMMTFRLDNTLVEQEHIEALNNVTMFG